VIYNSNSSEISSSSEISNSSDATNTALPVTKGRLARAWITSNSTENRRKAFKSKNTSTNRTPGTPTEAVMTARAWMPATVCKTLIARTPASVVTTSINRDASSSWLFLEIHEK
jgi:hypothetical protein